MLVQQCHIHDITATGLYAKGGANGVIIERCWVENIDGAGILVGFDTSPEFFDTTVNPEYYENIDGTVRNCMVLNTRYAGIGLYAAKNAKIINNTLVDVAREGHSGLYFGLTYQDWDPIAKRPPSLNPTIRNNIVFQSGSMNETVMEIRYDEELGGMNALSGMPVMSNNQYYVQSGTASFEDNRPASLFFRKPDPVAGSHIRGFGLYPKEIPNSLMRRLKTMTCLSHLHVLTEEQPPAHLILITMVLQGLRDQRMTLALMSG